MVEIFKIMESNVAAILKAAPQTGAVFNRQKTACVGCSFARFCTLTDVIAAYQLDETAFLSEMKKSLKQNPPLIKRRIK